MADGRGPPKDNSLKFWSRRGEFNSRPADYESVLWQNGKIRQIIKLLIFLHFIKPMRLIKPLKKAQFAQNFTRFYQKNGPWRWRFGLSDMEVTGTSLPRRWRTRQPWQVAPRGPSRQAALSPISPKLVSLSPGFGIQSSRGDKVHLRSKHDRYI
jgi:hypothetical protein